MPVRLKQICDWLHTEKGFPDRKISGVSIDTRTLDPGSLFVALKGQSKDGHDYVDQAFQKGAAAALVSNAYKISSKPERVLIRIPEPLDALQKLAGAKRGIFHGPVIGITGSNGKTTTKEMTAAVLSGKYIVHKTKGNLNNHIGVPLNILNCPDEADVMVLEMGMNHPGEIKNLCRIAVPTHGVITNIGRGHMAFFRDMEDIARAKAELLDFLKLDGMAFLNGDDPLLMAYHRTVKNTILFGLGSSCHVRADVSRDGIFPVLHTEKIRIRLNMPGMHQAYNALAALAVGQALHVDKAEIRQALETVRPFNHRLEVIEAGEFTVLDDTYNANPDSMIAALNTLIDYNREGRRVAILGEMLELGDTVSREHVRIGEWIAKHPVDLFLGIGPGMKQAVEAARSIRRMPTGVYPTSREAADEVQKLIEHGDIILVKGSRGVQMEMVVDALKQLNPSTIR
jgi:UDP-N-acetylmuramoyl-tripeptide--D-alanyl-D-alanine ligase